MAWTTFCIIIYKLTLNLTYNENILHNFLYSPDVMSSTGNCQERPDQNK
jgi:hypothetical protein